MAEKKFPLAIVISAVDKATGVLRGITQRLDQFHKPFRQLTGAFRVLMEKSGLKGIGLALKDVGRTALDIGRTLTFGLAGAAASAAVLVIGLTRSAKGVGDLSARLNISARTLQAWTYGFDRANVAPEAFSASLETLSKNLGDAKAGIGRALPIFRGLGIDPRRFRTVAELLPVLANRLSRISDPVKRAALAERLLGDAGSAMAVALAKGPKVLREMEAAAAKAGAIIDDETIKRASEFDDTLQSVFTTLKATGASVLGQLYPALMKIAQALQASVVAHLPQIREFAAKFGEKLPGYIDRTLKVLRALGGIMSSLGRGIEWLNDHIGTTATVLTVVATTIGGSLTAALVKLSAQLVRLGITFALAFPEVALIVAAIAAVVAAGWWLYSNWDKVSMAIGDSIDWVVDKFTRAWQWIKDTAVKAFNFIADKFESASKTNPMFAALRGTAWLMGKAWDAAGTSSPPAPSVGASLLAPNGNGPGPKQQVEVKVDLSNLPPGTRTSATASDGVLFDLNRGYALPGMP